MCRMPRLKSQRKRFSLISFVEWATEMLIMCDRNYACASWVDIKGTVKNHDEYKGTKSTIINRVKII